MTYVGIHTQQRRNDIKSFLLLLLFPMLILGLVYAFIYIIVANEEQPTHTPMELMIEVVPMILFFTGVWFAIAYFLNSYIISSATHSKHLDRKENKRIYNLVDNLRMAIVQIGQVSCGV